MELGSGVLYAEAPVGRVEVPVSKSLGTAAFPSPFRLAWMPGQPAAAGNSAVVLPDASTVIGPTALRKRLEPFAGEPSASRNMSVLSIDYGQRRVVLAGEPVELRPTEYAALCELAVHARRSLNRRR